MTDVNHQPPYDDSVRQVRQAAAERSRRAADWVSFYREILGIDGLIDQLFPHPQQRDQFEKTEEYAEIQQMLAKLRERNGHARQPDEPQRVITVRLPQSLHESLRHEAHHHKTSMNKLCISKLLQVIAEELVPSDFERREPALPTAESPEPCADPSPLPTFDLQQQRPHDPPFSRLSPVSLPSSPTLNDALSSGRPF
jgi:predicted HicB family RNase H-like nuclease